MATDPSSITPIWTSTDTSAKKLAVGGGILTGIGLAVLGAGAAVSTITGIGAVGAVWYAVNKWWK